MRCSRQFIVSLVALSAIFLPFQVQGHSYAPKQSLNGDDWKIQRCSEVQADAARISSAGFDDSSWTDGHVPGTVLTSYLATGEWPDPNFGDGQLSIPDDFFTADFWYRKEFSISGENSGRRVNLNFDGINWKAHVYLNGIHICDINGAFLRTSVDISDYICPGRNALAVHVVVNRNPGEYTIQHLKDPDGNGGVIGKDSPTFLASIGWNWIPTIRGRNSGIWNDVFLEFTGDVTISDLFVSTAMNLPDTTAADVRVKLKLANHSSADSNGELVVSFDGKNISYPVSVPAGNSVQVTLTPEECPGLHMVDPRLWWPNGYGEQNLYSMNVSYVSSGVLSDTDKTTFGVRQYSYQIENDILRLSVNGFPLVVRGGNWGMPESMLRCDSLGYDLRVRLHKQMNLNMIRNWIGMTADDEFYDACDRYGIMIWDDFWIANPLDGPDPDDHQIFSICASDKIRHFRNHPSLALWCGRNEGFPPADLDSAMCRMCHEFDGTRYYISHSASSPVTGLGPYENKDPEWYFKHRGITFHSEQGIVVPPTLEGFKAMMPEKYLWPINDMWGLHDWTQERVQIYYDDMVAHYGAPVGIEDFCNKAQMMNMEACKAIMESWQSNRGAGVLVWMSHPAWPSLICQTYDYFFEPTAAFFAFRTANEPLHIMMRADNNALEVINDTRKPADSLVANVTVTDLSGNVIVREQYPVSVRLNSKTRLSILDPGEECPEVYLVSLSLNDASGNVLSRNFYWVSGNGMDYHAMNDMEQAELACKVIDEADGRMTCEISNIGSIPAVMLRLLLIDKKTGRRILPIEYEDNYISLLPGESRKVSILAPESSGKGRQILVLQGWNYNRTQFKQ